MSPSAPRNYEEAYRTLRHLWQEAVELKYERDSIAWVKKARAANLTSEQFVDDLEAARLLAFADPFSEDFDEFILRLFVAQRFAKDLLEEERNAGR